MHSYEETIVQGHLFTACNFLRRTFLNLKTPLFEGKEI